MNKIKVINNEIQTELDSSISMVSSDSLSLMSVKKLTIKVLKNTELELEYEAEESKMEIEIILEKNIKCHILEIRQNKNSKVKYHYILNENSDLKMIKFYDCDTLKEFDVIDLNGENAKIEYQLKTIATNKQTYDLVVYHNAIHTISNIVNHGVTIKKGSLHFRTTGLVYPNIVGCIIDQKNKIVTFNDEKCEIIPKLLIEENDVIANHSAFIGKFEKDELFYLESRGIDEKNANLLLTKGFLFDNIEDKRFESIIEKYWR